MPLVTFIWTCFKMTSAINILTLCLSILNTDYGRRLPWLIVLREIHLYLPKIENLNTYICEEWRFLKISSNIVHIDSKCSIISLKFRSNFFQPFFSFLRIFPLNLIQIFIIFSSNIFEISAYCLQIIPKFSFCIILGPKVSTHGSEKFWRNMSIF